MKKMIYAIDEVLNEVVVEYEKRKRKVDFDGDLIKVSSDRLKLFKDKGITCVCCGKTATHFRKDENRGKGGAPSGTYHFNLYGENDLLFTKDHIIPRSKGGKDRHENYQTMCSICNKAKGNKI